MVVFLEPYANTLCAHFFFDDNPGFFELLQLPFMRCDAIFNLNGHGATMLTFTFLYVLCPSRITLINYLYVLGRHHSFI